MLMRFADNLWRVRAARRISQEVLADRAGIHRTQITLLEGGRRAPTLPTFVALAGSLDVPVGELLVGISFVPVLSGKAGEGEFVVTPPDLPFFYVPPDKDRRKP
jgi:transcriptional regulator with XRE-family HTH domain